jgi:hypothetical protein
LLDGKSQKRLNVTHRKERTIRRNPEKSGFYEGDYADESWRRRRREGGRRAGRRIVSLVKTRELERGVSRRTTK